METSDNGEIKGVTNTYDNCIASIDAAILEVAATLDQELRQTSTEPEETNDVDTEETKHVEVFQPRHDYQNHQAGIKPAQGQ